jgi:hypothetical protein
LSSEIERRPQVFPEKSISGRLSGNDGAGRFAPIPTSVLGLGLEDFPFVSVALDTNNDGRTDIVRAYLTLNGNTGYRVYQTVP